MSQLIDLDELVPILVRSLDLRPIVTVPCGGTGSGNIIKELQEYFDVNVLLNAYDDGKSTGRIRDEFAMLGPSDIVKNITTLVDTKKFPGLSAFMDYRCINNDPSDNQIIREEMTVIAGNSEVNGSLLSADRFVALFYNVEQQFAPVLREYFDLFCRNLSGSFDLRDMGVRNIVFTGCFIKNERDYEATIEELRGLFGVSPKIVLNGFESRRLIGLSEEGTLLPSEHAIIEYKGGSEVRTLYAIERKMTKEEILNIERLSMLEQKKAYIESNFNTGIECNPKAIDAIRKSDVILFGPTTYNSSLFPTLMTLGISEAVRESRASKMLVVNLVKEESMATASYFPSRLKEMYGIDVDFILASNISGHVNDNFVPVDISELQKYGQVIKGDFYQGLGKHRADMVAKTALLLYALSGGTRE